MIKLAGPVERVVVAHARLLFAGEHTSSARPGYADGAYVSGLRAGQLLASVANSYNRIR